MAEAYLSIRRWREVNYLPPRVSASVTASRAAFFSLPFAFWISFFCVRFWVWFLAFSVLCLPGFVVKVVHINFHLAVFNVFGRSLHFWLIFSCFSNCSELVLHLLAWVAWLGYVWHSCGDGSVTCPVFLLGCLPFSIYLKHLPINILHVTF